MHSLIGNVILIIVSQMFLFVRVVISLDAAHLKSKWGGTLYAATVLTATRETIVIAFAIIIGNEDGNGWRYFCSNLERACSVLTLPHPVERVICLLSFRIGTRV